MALKRIARELTVFGINEPSYSFTIDDKYNVTLPSSYPFSDAGPIIINDINVPFTPRDKLKDLLDNYIATYELNPLTLVYCHNRPLVKENIQTDHQCFQQNSPLNDHIPEDHSIVTLDREGTPNILANGTDTEFIERNKGRFSGLFVLDCLMWNKDDENSAETPINIIKTTLPLVKSGGYAIYTVLPGVIDAVKAVVGGEIIEDPNSVTCYKKYLKILVP